MKAREKLEDVKPLKLLSWKGDYEDAEFWLVEKDFGKFIQHAFIILKFRRTILLSTVQLLTKILE